MLALSDSTVISDCSTLTVSPTFTSSSITPTSAKSPMSGTWMLTNAMSCLRVVLLQACRGLILSARMAYFLIASATFFAGSLPSSASARRAASTM